MSLLDMIEAAKAGAALSFGRAPKAVRLDETQGVLTLDEADDTRTDVAATSLRLACRCAWCTRARIDGVFPSSFAAVAIENLELIGNYALRPRFSDGHDRGIFPWSFIRDIAAAETAAQPPAEDLHHV